MKVKYKGKIAIIADDSEKAQQIRDGHDYHITDEGELVIGPQGTGRTLYEIRESINQTTNYPELKQAVLDLTDALIKHEFEED